MNKIILLSLVILFLTASKGFSWENTITHPALSEDVAVRYFGHIAMGESVNGKSALEWVRDGAKLEDEGSIPQFLAGTARSMNHFHNPFKADFAFAGLSDLPFLIPNGTSAIRWAQDGPYQQSKHWDDWSWQAVRTLYLGYLLEQDPTTRDVTYSKVLKGLGYQMHLIQDMSQPNHVRNDTHVLDGGGYTVGLETWAAAHDDDVKKDLNSYTTLPAVSVNLTAEFLADPSLAPVANLFDTRNYSQNRIPSASLDQGLAEYTNANFFSEDTAFAAEAFAPEDPRYLPHPNKAETNLQDFIDNKLDGEPVVDGEDAYLSFKISKENTSGEKVACLAKPGVNTKKYFIESGEGASFYRSFKLDESCYEEYTKKLIPYSVAYSKAMLEYFYRGKMELSFPDPPNERFDFIRLRARNTTPTGEEISKIEDVKLVVTYKLMKEDPAQGKIIRAGDDFHYIVVPFNGDLSTVAISRDNSVPLEFDLAASPLPMLAYDVTLQVVVKGELGKETGAIAVGTTVLPSAAGSIDVTLPDRGVYGVTAPDGAFKDIRARATNVSGVAMTDGNIELLLRYKLADQDPFNDEPTGKSPADPEYYYLKVTEKNLIRQIPSGSAVDLVFDLSATPLPLTATDLHAYVVYTEPNRVAFGYRDIAEPTPLDVVNNMDHVCIDGNYLVAGSQEAIDSVGTGAFGRPNKDIYPHRLKDVYLSFSSSLASDTNYSVKFPYIEPGEYGRVFVLTDYGFNFSISETVENIAGPVEDPWSLAFLPYADTLDAVLNQLVSENGEYVDYYPGMSTGRGIKSWWYVHYENPASPENATCDWTTAQPNLVGQPVMEIPE